MDESGPRGRSEAEASAPGSSTKQDPVERALADLGREIRVRLRRPGPPGLDWLALFDELRTRLRTLGMRPYEGDVDDFGLDPDLLRDAAPLFDFLADRWWRVEVSGLSRLPAEEPVLYVANRSGLLPWDGLMIAHSVERARGRGARPRFLVADWLVTLPFAQSTLARLGGVRACRENAERLLQTGRSVLAFPEGVKGAAKVYRERYRLQRFGRGGAVRLALAGGLPIVPVAVIGAEAAHPILFKVQTLARLVGLPFVPVTPTFPWLGPLGAIPLPSKWSIEFGEPLRLELGESDELRVLRGNEELRRRIQEMLDNGLRRHR